jgi:hypothetical protein
MSKKIPLMLVAGAASAIASRPIATLTSSDAFTLSGVHIAGTSVSAWPLTIGDEIKDLAAPAVIHFADNTQIGVSKGSSVKLEFVGGRTVVRLTSGSMTYQSGSSQAIRVFALDKEVNSAQANISIKGNDVSVNHPDHPLHPTHPVAPPEKPPGRSQGE